MQLANAQTNGELVFFSNLGEKFYIVLNGIQQNQKPESNIKIEGLLEGWYSCRVISENNLFSLEQNVGVVNNMVITYRIINKKGKHRLRYFTEVAKNTYVNPQGISTVTYHPEPITQTNTTDVPTQSTQTSTTQSTTGTSGTTTQQVNTNTNEIGISTQVNETGLGGVNETINVSIGISGIGMNTEIEESGMNEEMENIQMNLGINTTGAGVNQSGTINNSQSQTVTTTTTTTLNGGTVIVENITPTTSTSVLNSGNCLVDNTGIEKALTMVKDESFSEDKMRVAKQFARNKCLTVNQISQFGKLFSFSEDILDFVKFAHANCMNKKDYYELMELFTFSDDKKELENFLNSRN